LAYLKIGSLKYSTQGSMRLCHSPDGSTSPKYKLLCFKPP
jgi:hypothetical protein